MKTSRKMMDKWAAHIDERRTIMAFLNWLESQRGRDVGRGQWWPENWLDEYHGIDQRRLEKERRALLATMK